MLIRPVHDVALSVALDGDTPTATRTAPVDVPDDVGTGLVAGGLWEKARPPRKTKKAAAKKAAAKKAAAKKAAGTKATPADPTPVNNTEESPDDAA